MLIRQYVNPLTWWDYVYNIPNDGNDYDVVFEGGTYGFPSFIGDQIIDHSAGGSITLRAHIPLDAKIDIPYTNTTWYILCDRVHVDGLHFVGNPYLFDLSIDPTFRALNLYVGGWSPGGGRMYPTELITTRVRMDGGRIRFYYIGSTDPAYYTNILIDDCVVREGGNGTSFVITSAQYVHAWIRNINAETVNGPDEEWPGSEAYAGLLAFTGGCQWLELYDLGGESTAYITGCNALSVMRGSRNHDMHSVRLNRIRTKDVRVYIKDTVLKGYWAEGHVGTYPNGRGITHLFYYHFNNNDYPTLGQRPVIEFENVTLESRIGAAVNDDEYTVDPRNPFRELAWMNASASYVFWDCTFRWVLEDGAPTVYNNATMAAFRDAEHNYDLTTHNCTYDLPNNAVHWLDAGFSNRVVTETTKTRGYKDENWMRVHTPSFPERVNLLVNPSIEGDIANPETWWIGGLNRNEIVNDRTNAYDGDQFCRNYAWRNDPYGEPNGLGSLTSAAHPLDVAIPNNTRLYLRFRARYTALEQHDPTNRTQLNVTMVGTDHLYGVYVVDPASLKPGWNLLDTAITTTGIVSTLTVSFALHLGLWTDYTKVGREAWDIDMVELYQEAG